jgi:hypothetical protein
VSACFFVFPPALDRNAFVARFSAAGAGTALLAETADLSASNPYFPYPLAVTAAQRVTSLHFSVRAGILKVSMRAIWAGRDRWRFLAAEWADLAQCHDLCWDLLTYGAMRMPKAIGRAGLVVLRPELVDDLLVS